MSVKILSFVAMAVGFYVLLPLSGVQAMASRPDKTYQQYTAFFEKVYKTFEDNYYLAPDRKIYDDFLQKFNSHIYAQLKGEGKSDDYVRWRSAWYLVDMLRSREDKFTQFYPPKPAEKFQHEALGQKIDLGVEGKKNDLGFLVTRIEPRSDAYDKGLREEDIIVQVDGESLKAMTQEVIEGKLTPLVDSKVQLSFLSHETKTQKTIEVVSKEYFKQTVFMHPVPVDGVFCLEVPKFNRMTGEDMYRFLKVIEAQNPKGLVLDLRGNPGGPPLAAREIAAFFLKGGEEFTYFQKRNAPKASLDVPDIGGQHQFTRPVVILVDAETGSAAELFAGIMQFRGRAVVLGVNTAGQILLKSMFSMDDGSMIAMVTARGYYPNGDIFTFDGIAPDKIITDAPKEGLINLAAALIAMQNR